jgi:hypothetical protein
MASHTLGALEFADGIRHFDPQQLGRALLGADLYPPGHSVVQGSWILCFGGSSLSLWIFRWALLFLSTVVVLQLASRSGVKGAAARIAAGGVWLASPFLLGLSATVLVEPVAILLLLASLLSVDALVQNPKRRTLILTCILLSGTVLTKYNVGLPLIPALGVFALGEFFRGRRREAMALFLVAGIALAGWALFLSLQVDGWENFLRFARNRSTTEGWSMLERLLAYLGIYATRGVTHPGVLGLMVVLVGGHLLTPRSRSRLLPLGALYILITLLGLSRHPYLLSRNLSAAMAVFAALAGSGAGRMIEFGLPALAPRMRMGARARATLAWAGAGLSCALLLAALPGARAEYRHHDPPELERLKPLSRILSEEMGHPGEILVLGCFNEFSNAWVKLLGRQLPEAGPVWIDLPPPVERTRSEIPSAY